MNNHTRQFIIAIDGPSGSGKSTLSQMLAKRLGFLAVNTGLIYRALAVFSRKRISRHQGTQKMRALVYALSLNMIERELVIGEISVEELFSPETGLLASKLSRDPAVRKAINQRIRDWVATNNAVVEGRDVNTLIFPDATLKLYLSAREAVRTARLHQRESSTPQAAKAGLERDSIDTAKSYGTLEVARNVLIIDTTRLTIARVCEMLEKLVKAC